MADSDQVAVLRSGVSAWNSWRDQHPDVEPDLSGAPLRGLDLAGANLSAADLRQADLRGTILRGAALARAQLDGANLFKAVLENSDLDGAVLLGAQFLNCAQLLTARNWANTQRDSALACGAAIPKA
ncbi:MAG TPA: pentapeptide repeat-containing protein [Dongiaceae bacterium]|nr:pentapeptide repeat-containing protein [Dongiaceae bacterium]